MIVPACETSTCPSLGTLLEGYAPIPCGYDRVVTAVCDDSRAVAPGAVFFARRGLRVDASRFAKGAIASGAAAVVVEGGPTSVRLDAGAVVVAIRDVAGAIGHAASRFYADPSEHLCVAAVTGTNGKTSVTHLTARACGDRCAVMGTLGAGRPGKLESVTLTTPGPIEIHRRLAALRDAGIDMLAMEVSSHALDQRRIEAVDIDTAVFTNLSRDHLDYHPDMDAYARAKASLFETPGLAHAVVNADDRFGRELIGSMPAGIESVAVTLGDERSFTGRLHPERAGTRHRGASGVVAAGGIALGERDTGDPPCWAVQRVQPARGARRRVSAWTSARHGAPAARRRRTDRGPDATHGRWLAAPRRRRLFPYP